MGLVARLRARRLPDWDDPTQCVFHRVTIDLDACDGCKLCTIVCPANVLELAGEKGAKKARVIDAFHACISCNNCQAICASGAIAATQAYDFTGYYHRGARGAFTLPRRF